MPSMFGKDGKKKELIKGLNSIYESIQREHQISPGDFPDIRKMQVSIFSLFVFLIRYGLSFIRVDRELLKLIYKLLFAKRITNLDLHFY